MTKEELIAQQKEISRKLEAIRLEEKHSYYKEELQHEYPEKFPFYVDDHDEVTMGWFLQSKAYSEDGKVAWDDYAEAKRRWEAYPKLVSSLLSTYDCGDALESEIELLKELGELEE